MTTFPTLAETDSDGAASSLRLRGSSTLSSIVHSLNLNKLLNIFLTVAIFFIFVLLN